MPSTAEGETSATLDRSGCAPPTPSICVGSGDPMIRSSRSSRSAASAGRSSARKYSPLDVPPRICMARTPSYRASPVIASLRWLAPPGNPRRACQRRGAPEELRLMVLIYPRARLDAFAGALGVLGVGDVLDLGQLGAEVVQVDAEHALRQVLAVGVLLGDPRGGRGDRRGDVQPGDGAHAVVVGDDRVAGADRLAAQRDRDIYRPRGLLDRALRGDVRGPGG